MAQPFASAAHLEAAPGSLAAISPRRDRRAAANRIGRAPHAANDDRQLPLRLKSTHDADLDVDLFSGGGGASEGIEAATGKPVDIAANHDKWAIAMHEANHPLTEHHRADVFEVDPRVVCRGRPVRLLWASPDCRHYSRAKGGPLVNRKIRGLMWVVIRWASLPEWQRPKVIFVENVPEIVTYGPLIGEPVPYPYPDGSRAAPDIEGVPDKAWEGLFFAQWLGTLAKLGYHIEWRILEAHKYGVPTIRKRWYLIARRDGHPIVWPNVSHGAPTGEAVKAGLLKPYRTAAEGIDFTLPARSIFGRAKPLAAKTLDRIAYGAHRFMIAQSLSAGPEPFVVTCNHAGKGFRGHGTHEPAKTITAARDAHGLVLPYLTKIQQRPLGRSPADPVGIAYIAQHNGGEIGHAAKEPASTITSRGTQQQPVIATVTRLHGKSIGQPAAEPATTVETRNTHAVQTAQLLVLKGTAMVGRPLTEPSPTVLANGLHLGEVRTTLASVAPASGDTTAALSFEDALLDAFPASLHDPIRAVRRFLARVAWRGTRGLRKLPPTAPDAFLIGLAARLDYVGQPTDLPHLLGLVRLRGAWYQMVDIRMRMLVPRELANFQGFPADYIIDRGADGRPLTQEQQVARIGNSVCPEMARLLVAANAPPLRDRAAA